jgi:hypothetical protein
VVSWGIGHQNGGVSKCVILRTLTYNNIFINLINLITFSSTIHTALTATKENIAFDTKKICFWREPRARSPSDRAGRAYGGYTLRSVIEAPLITREVLHETYFLLVIMAADAQARPFLQFQASC